MHKQIILQSIFSFLIGSLLIACSSNTNNTKSYKELYKIRVNTKVGIMDERGSIIAEPQYDDAGLVGIDMIRVESEGKNWFLDSNGGLLPLPNGIQEVSPFYGEFAVYENNRDKVGLINRDGEIVVEAIYKEIVVDEYNNKTNGYIVKDTLGKEGYIDVNGILVQPCIYEYLGRCRDDRICFKLNGKSGYLNHLGNVVIEPIYEDVYSFSNGLGVVKKDGISMVIDPNGNKIDEIAYDNILTGFRDNRAFISSNDTIWLIDNHGKKIKALDADSVFGFVDGFARFIKDGKNGVVGSFGNICIPAVYDSLDITASGLFVVSYDNKLGVIDTLNNYVLRAKNENCFYWLNDRLSLIVSYEENPNGYGMFCYYDKKGNLVWRDIVDELTYWPEDITKEDIVSFIDSKKSRLDPIEGIYYVNIEANVTENGHTTQSKSKSTFMAILQGDDAYYALLLDELPEQHYWRKKFVKIGDLNNYAVIDNGDGDWAEDGKIVLEDPNHFEFTLRSLSSNNYYTIFIHCEFTKDYPESAFYDKIQQAEWTGSGFALGDGYIATNYHVIEGAKNISIRDINDEGVAYKGYTVATDKVHDLAIVKIVDSKYSGGNSIPYTIGKSSPKVGDEIFVLGYPLVSTMGTEIKLTNGIICAASGYKGDNSSYQISAAVQPGNSGGPMLDMEGNVVGIVSAKHMEAESAGYAVKIQYLLSLIKDSNIDIKLSNNSKVKNKKLSKKVVQIKPYVYLIECSSK